MRKKTERKLVLFGSLMEGLNGIFADLSAEVVKTEGTFAHSAAGHVIAFQETLQDFTNAARAAVAKSDKLTQKERAETQSRVNDILYDFFQEWFKVK